MSASQVQVPSFKWAENATHMWVTVEVSDCQNAAIEFKPQEISFKGQDKEGKQFELDLKLKKTIDPVRSKWVAHGREVQIALAKSEESQGWWNGLLADKNAYKGRIKIDWALWQDEDEVKEAPAGFGQGGMESMMGGMGGGMPGMSGAGGMDFSKLMAGMNGGQGQGEGGPEDEDDEELDSDDEGLPELETAAAQPPKDASALNTAANEKATEQQEKTDEQPAAQEQTPSQTATSE